MKNRHFDRLAIHLAFRMKHMDVIINSLLEEYPYSVIEQFLESIDFSERDFFRLQRRNA